MSETVSGSSLRKTIAQRMLAGSQQTAPVTLMVKADATELLNLRQQFKQEAQLRQSQIPGVTDMFVKLTGEALRYHPELLHQWVDNGLIVPDGIHIAVGVDTEQGLIAPVLRDVPFLPLTELSRQLRDLIERAHTRKLTTEELQGGTFTLSNLGRSCVDGFTPIVNLPQSAILGIGRIRREPTVVEDEIVIRDQVSLSLTFDHRVHDGVPAAAFLQTLSEILERPGIQLIV